MSPKGKKSSSLWYSCEKCGCFLGHKDLDVHLKFCPQTTENLSNDYGFILNKSLYSTLEETAPIDAISHLTNDIICLSQSALQLCGLMIGDKALVKTNNYSEVKTVWPTTKGSITSAYCTKLGLTESWGLKLGPVVVSRFQSVARPASLVSIEITKQADAPESVDHFLIDLKHKLRDKIVSVGTRQSICFYGRRVKFIVTKVEAIKEVVEEVKDDTEALKQITDDPEALKLITDDPEALKRITDDPESLNQITDSLKSLKVKDDVASTKFYRLCDVTKFVLVQPKKSATRSDDEFALKFNAFGGYKSIVEDLKETISFSLQTGGDKGIKLSSGVLLYGMNGTGKSHLAQCLIQELGVNSVKIQSGDVYSKFYGETESNLRSLFRKAIDLAPCIILLDDVDTLCSKRVSSASNQGSRVVASIVTLIDSLQNENVFVIATSSQPHLLEPALRRPGRLDREIELPVPMASDRREILQCLLKRAGCSGVDPSMAASDVDPSMAASDRDPQMAASDRDPPMAACDRDHLMADSVADAAHGFVAADLSALLSHAQACQARRRPRALEVADLKWALTQVKPSAMREVYVQVPNVRWSDIGGQEELKLKLRQAVEWPIRHPEAFARLGINPPKGVLMYGPPGCSKTMIAKALATESKLNFISIKGSELFSKWVGESERAVRATFKRARSVAPSVVFFDEIDALAGDRGGGGEGRGGGAQVQERVLAQLLTELDGVEPLGNVSVIAATNRPDRIDKALLRPGRLDRLVYVPLPDLQTRKQILELQFRKTPISDDVDVDELSSLTEGYSGAEVVAVCQEAALSALQEDISAAQVSQSHFQHALTIITPRTSKTLLKLYEEYRSHK
ncbi:LOW QUALITY PROTEIN: ATPase family protein 2 homolog [Nilaparvata lugens]|uniref:LOW QUALITY PROTEIN: ATPase family protein 2 homolog n=1 Tax=Nilaparvata lugens TaxID=108931 RepID=UPI00193DE080|nr:LOW QUALITY PROTEIN: ATPase family protein 2 homolog [Nilaparvata lugens]